jgi:hypothetical protein
MGIKSNVPRSAGEGLAPRLGMSVSPTRDQPDAGARTKDVGQRRIAGHLGGWMCMDAPPMPADWVSLAVITRRGHWT